MKKKKYLNKVTSLHTIYLVQLYGVIAIIFPIKSDVLNVNISNTGIQDFKLHDMISVSMPGYNDNVTQ